jgi:hypothetical protein
MNAWKLNLITAEALWLPVKSDTPPASFPRRKAGLMYECPVTGKHLEWNPMKDAEQAMRLIMHFNLRLAYCAEGSPAIRYVSAHQEWDGNSWNWQYIPVRPENPAEALREAVCRAVAYVHQSAHTQP